MNKEYKKDDNSYVTISTIDEPYGILVNALKKSGFVAPCASDMAGYLISCLARPGILGIIDYNENIDKTISALQQLKKTI